MSLADAFKHLAPKLPEYKASYRAIYFEPIALSGERFAIGIMAKSDTGETRLVQTLSSKVMHCMYGEDYQAINNLVSLVLKGAQSHLKSGQELSTWRPPLSGVYLGEIQTTHSNSGMEGVLFQAISNYSSLYRGEIITNGLNDYEGNEDIEIDDDLNIGLIQQVRSIIVSKRPDYANRWKKEVIVKDNTKVRIDYLGAHYNANLSNFDVIDITRAFNFAKAKLFDLEVLREKRKRETISSQQQYELLVSMPNTERTAAHERFVDIVSLADARELSVVKEPSAEKLAARILKLDAA